MSLYLYPGTTEEAMKMDKDVTSALNDFTALFKDGVTQEDAGFLINKDDAANPIKVVKEEKVEVKHEVVHVDNIPSSSGGNCVEEVKNTNDVTSRLPIPGKYFYICYI